MFGSGAYLPDPAEGINKSGDLPKLTVVSRTRNFERRWCPRCGRSCDRDRTRKRVLHDVGDQVSGRPRDLHVTYSQHYCGTCRQYFNAHMADYVLPQSHYTHRVVSLAVRLVVEDGLEIGVNSQFLSVSAWWD